MNKQDLKQLIQEELKSILNENFRVKQYRIYLDKDYDRYYGDYDDKEEVISSAVKMSTDGSYVEVYDDVYSKTIWTSQNN